MVPGSAPAVPAMMATTSPMWIRPVWRTADKALAIMASVLLVRGATRAVTPQYSCRRRRIRSSEVMARMGALGRYWDTTPAV